MITKKRIAICILSLLLGVLIAASAVVAYAYFTKKDIYDGYLSGQVELLFDRLNDDGIGAYGQSTGIAADKNAEWGSEANPYVISNVRHLYNLAELQRLGYFYKKHISYNTETDLTHLPYFLVSTPSYQPVLINGSNFRAISAIGTDQYPFIGSVKGVTGDEKVDVGGVGSDTSVIHKVTVNGSPATPDVGLFGYVGFLGTPPEGSTEDTTFLGTPSVISNLVLSDVTVKVENNLADAIESFVEDIALGGGGHRYSFSDLYNAADTSSYDSVPHENHHIGILAGHVSYSLVNMISVYYSSDDVVAIDLTDKSVVGGIEANYMSAAGILGFIYNLNPEYDEETGHITAGSGSDISDLSYTMVGGGGLESKDKPGYVLAKSIYETYGFLGKDNPIEPDSPLFIKDATTAGGTPLCHEWIRDLIFGLGQVATGSYYFYDGVFTFALSTPEDVIEATWPEEVPEFAIGQNDPSQWHTNYSKGQRSVSAYIRQIKSDEELQSAIAAGTPLVIMKDVNDTSGFMMSLYDQSVSSGSGGFNTRYTTTGSSRVYATTDEIAALIESYKGSPDEFKAGFEAGTTDEQVARIMNALENGEEGQTWRVINVDTTASNLTASEMQAQIEELRLKYKILSKYLEGNYSFFSGDSPVSVDSNGIDDYYEYADSEYDGFFYYTSTWFFATFYTYYWQSKDGELETIDENTTTAPNKFFTQVTGESWQGENVYTRDDHKGVVLTQASDSSVSFYSTSSSAIMNGQYLFKLTGQKITYFFSPLGDENYYYMTDTSLTNPIPSTSLAPTGELSASGLKYYTHSSRKGVLIDRYYTYNFYSKAKDQTSATDDNYLRMIKAQFWLLGTHYSIWNGNNEAATKTDHFSYILGATPRNLSNSTAATVRFRDDGTCYIQYALDSVSQFVNYNGSTFNAVLSPSSGTVLSIYALEGTQALSYGRVTFDPNGISDPNNDSCHSFRADEYVLWPESSSIDVATAGTESSVTAGVNTQYSVISLEELSWRNGNAFDNNGILHGGNLTKKFRMMDGISFGATLNYNGSLGTSGFIEAPIGTVGTKTTIPESCIAFRVNKQSTEPQKIRVILSVPVSGYYEGEEEYDLGDYERYFCLWEMPEAGSEPITIFTARDYVERFTIPRSHPYEPGTLPESSSSEYVTVTYDGEEYRSYLNGDRILVAYEFKVYSEGVYVLGTSTSTSDESILAAKDTAPMEIVYFSADGVASEGRDGASGSQIGTIDYVYSYGGNIIPVAPNSETDSEGKENYNTYYPSYCIMYMTSIPEDTKEPFLNINEELVHVRRYISDEENPKSTDGYLTTKSGSIMTYSFGRDKYTRFAQYSRLADNVKARE